MANISVDEATVRSGVPRRTLEEWAERGLLVLHLGPKTADKFVDEDELDRVVESLGWLNLSSQVWQGNEED
jgi:hypothetical protein